MTSTTITPSLKFYLSSVVAFIFSVVCLLVPARPNNVNLTVTGSGQGTYEDFDTPYCYVSVNMENKTFRTLCKPDYAVLEKESDGQWIFVSRGNIPQRITGLLCTAETQPRHFISGRKSSPLFPPANTESLYTTVLKVCL